MYITMITFPLMGSIISGFLGRTLGVKGSQIITTTCVVATTLLAMLAFIEVALNQSSVSIHLFRWIDSDSLHLIWGFNFDSLTVSMLIPVLIVSSLVHLYSIGYMSNDPHNQRFFSYLSLFTFMMIILVTANNYLLMFVGWEGVGVCSYLLVSFWFTRIAANQSSLAAFLTNRVGDCFLTIGMFVLLIAFGNIDYSTVFALSPYISEDIITLIGILLLLGAMAKSSQIGLHVWLPMAMEGPTPVSALIHAATMVTAGVYLLMRSSPLIEYSSTALLLCLWVGAITTVFSSLIGLFQQDIKKVIAYSTMSQLGMMVIAVGLSSYSLALFHLVNHAFYKALLFLGAGSVIHAVADNQDFRKYGGLKAFLPLTYSVMLIASLSLVAFPFMTGFYSKDFILESAYGYYSFSTTSVYFIATIGAMFTTLYSVKVLYLTFLTNPNGPQASYKSAHEGDLYMSLPLIILAIFSIIFGYLTKDLFIGLGSDIFSDNSIFIHPNHEITLMTEFAVPVLFKLLPLIFTILLSLIYIFISETKNNALVSFKFSRFGYNLYSFFNQRFFVEAFYNRFLTDQVLKYGGQTTKVIDKGSVEIIGPTGLEKGLVYSGNFVARLDKVQVTYIALSMLIGLITYITTFFLLDSTSLDFLYTMILLPIISNKRPEANNVTTRNSYLTNMFNSFSSSAVFCMPEDPNSDDSNDSDDADESEEWSAEGTPDGESYHPTEARADDTSAIMDNCPTREELEEYYVTKKAAIIDDHNNRPRQPNEDSLETDLKCLDDQKSDICELMFFPDDTEVNPANPLTQREETSSNENVDKALEFEVNETQAEASSSKRKREDSPDELESSKRQKPDTDLDAKDESKEESKEESKVSQSKNDPKDNNGSGGNDGPAGSSGPAGPASNSGNPPSDNSNNTGQDTSNNNRVIDNCDTNKSDYANNLLFTLIEVVLQIMNEFSLYFI